MDINNTELDTVILSAVKEAHARAEESTAGARNKMQSAINNRIMCASLVEKAKQIHKRDLNEFLADAGISSEQVKAYLSLHDAASKRPALHDKRQLVLCGILETADKPEQPMKSAMPASVISVSSSYIGKLNKTLDRRPVTEWSDDEREQVKDVLKPMLELYNKL